MTLTEAALTEAVLVEEVLAETVPVQLVAASGPITRLPGVSSDVIPPAIACPIPPYPAGPDPA